MMRRFFLISLGCPKNRVDSEYCLGLFSEIGGELVLNPEDADYVIVNTCAFIRPAVEESIETILELAELKKEKQFKLIVSGCLPGRYKEELIKDIKEGISELMKMNVISVQKTGPYKNLLIYSRKNRPKELYSNR